MLSVQSYAQENAVKSTKHVPSIFKAHIAHYESLNILQDNTHNKLHPLSYLASIANDHVLYYDKEMKAEDSSLFRHAMATEIQNFKNEKKQIDQTAR